MAWLQRGRSTPDVANARTLFLVVNDVLAEKVVVAKCRIRLIDAECLAHACNLGLDCVQIDGRREPRDLGWVAVLKRDLQGCACVS